MAVIGATQTLLTPSTGARKATSFPLGLTAAAVRSGAPSRSSRGIRVDGEPAQAPADGAAASAADGAAAATKGCAAAAVAPAAGCTTATLTDAAPGLTAGCDAVTLTDAAPAAMVRGTVDAAANPATAYAV